MSEGDRPQYLYRIRPTRVDMLNSGLTPEEQEIVGRHFTYLSELAEEGVVAMAGRTATDDENAFGIVLFYADSEADAQRIMSDDPAVATGLMQAELFPFRVAITGRDPQH